MKMNIRLQPDADVRAVQRGVFVCGGALFCRELRGCGRLGSRSPAEEEGPDKYTFFVLDRIMDGNPRLLLSDHERLIISE